MGNQDIMNFEWESFHAFSIYVRLKVIEAAFR